MLAIEESLDLRPLQSGIALRPDDSPEQSKPRNAVSMSKWSNVFLQIIGYLLIISALTGCTDSASKPENDYLIRIGDKVMTAPEFKEALEVAKTAYPFNLRQNPQDLKQAQVRLLNQMTEEMILLKRAEELGIEVSEAEVEKAAAEIKSDYPEDLFEETLLESAISYEAWKNRLKTHLIMGKVVDRELGDQVVITPGDIARYYGENYKGQPLESDIDENSQDINETIIRNLRRKKLEQAYPSWIKALKAKYTIEINHALWQKITGSKDAAENDPGSRVSEDK
jgi:hypothetical protein